MGRNDGFTSVQFLILLVCEAHSDTSVRPWARGPDMLAESVHPDPSLILLCFPSLWRPGGAGPQAGSVGGEGRGRRGSFGCCRDKALSLKLGDGYACCYSLYAFLWVLNRS